jgi:hypothetical protein
MKLDKLTYKEDNQIGLTTDQTSQSDKVLFFADPHFLFLKPTQRKHILFFPQTQLKSLKNKKSLLS